MVLAFLVYVEEIDVIVAVKRMQYLNERVSDGYSNRFNIENSGNVSTQRRQPYLPRISCGDHSRFRNGFGLHVSIGSQNGADPGCDLAVTVQNDLKSQAMGQS